ncbi:cell shape determination protein CcmA [Novosphingobium sp. PC22D]|uniref:bactofilin family protein n=1 Tax=Novosphingobium sp. PC22D TaxID=1962403 RepID=UPI000BF08651|nr:polymer-forming cytoskeletal protein [Novosphingobium sp. PC22D]PEQ12097.1 cell shape determination protein CcmA [Novosphingobium sp. PC22D]
MARSVPMSGRSGDSATFSIFGGDTVIRGDVTAEADLHVDGRIEGDITCKSIVQGEASEISGAIAAESVRISGRVTGTIAAREVVILKSARIEGDVSYDVLTIEQGAQIDGRLSPRGAAPGIAQRGDQGEARLILAAPAE